MDFRFSQEDEEFRKEIGQFVDSELPWDWRTRTIDSEEPEDSPLVNQFRKKLADKGWLTMAWPEEYGGQAAPHIRQMIFSEEMAYRDVPAGDSGIRMVGPILMLYGTEEQKQYFLPRIAKADISWCQGYSEPDAGSDLASLQTRAVEDGDDFVLNGSKIWNGAHSGADWMFLLVRTDPEVKPQQGISFLLVDMKTPGITVRPIITLDGWHYVNEVFFEDVRVPKHNRIGEEGKGWTYAKFLLGHERTGIAGVQRSRKLIGKLKENTRDLEAEQRARIGQLELDLMALEYTELRVLTAEQAGQSPGPEASLLKIKGSELTQAVFQLSIETLGYHTLPYPIPASEWGSNNPLVPEHVGNVVAAHLYARAATIFGGSNEIQRGIIAKAVLGL